MKKYDIIMGGWGKVGEPVHGRGLHWGAKVKARGRAVIVRDILIKVF